MTFDLIIIGNELLKGKIQDINGSFLAKTLNQSHHHLRKIHIISDDEKEMTKALNEAKESSDIIITTGGLGPTKDDITKNVLSNFFNKKLQFSESALKLTQAQYSRGNKEYYQDKHHYHFIPEGFEVVNNPHGYAPGLFYQTKDLKIFSCPGVPSEFQSMLEAEILPKIENSQVILKEVVIRTWKIPEAKIFHHLCPELWDDLSKFGEVSSLPHYFGVDIGVSIQAQSTEEIDKIEKEIIEHTLQTELASYIWSTGTEAIEEVIVKKAIEKKLTIGFSESCTGGLCASRITDVSGSSAVFWGSVVSYANEVKMKSLNVSKEILKNHGAVSSETAFEMAQGAREHLAVDIAVSTTGIAGPGGGSPEKPVGTVGIGISTKDSTSSEIYQFRGNRKVLKRRFSDQALVTLLEAINSY